MFCKFITSEKVYIDVVEAHAMTQAWDQLLNQYDLSRLFCSGQILLVTKSPNGVMQRFADSGAINTDLIVPQLPSVIDDFLVTIVNTEKI